MKRLSFVFSLFALVLFQACEGPPGPQGPPGLDGLDAVNIVATTYEVSVDFTGEENYEAIFDWPEELVESDVVQTYIQWEVDNNGNSIWRALPQTVFLQEGPLVYNYDFTVFDIRLFLDGAINPSILGPEWTDNQVFRIVVIPSDFPDARLDLTDYEAVTEFLGVTEEDFKNNSLQKKKSNN